MAEEMTKAKFVSLIEEIRERAMKLAPAAHGGYLVIRPEDGAVQFCYWRSLDEAIEAKRERLRVLDILINNAERRVRDGQQQESIN